MGEKLFKIKLTDREANNVKWYKNIISFEVNALIIFLSTEEFKLPGDGNNIVNSHFTLNFVDDKVVLLPKYLLEDSIITITEQTEKE